VCSKNAAPDQLLEDEETTRHINFFQTKVLKGEQQSKPFKPSDLNSCKHTRASDSVYKKRSRSLAHPGHPNINI